MACPAAPMPACLTHQPCCQTRAHPDLKVHKDQPARWDCRASLGRLVPLVHKGRPDQLGHLALKERQA